MQDAKGKGFILDRIEQQARVTEVRYEDTYSGPKVNASPHDEGRYLRDPEATTQLLTFARGSERQCSPAAGSYMYRSRDSLEQKPRYRCWKKVITSVNRWGGGKGKAGFWLDLSQALLTLNSSMRTVPKRQQAHETVPV